MLVKPGDTLAKDQAVLELETDKATIEVPSSVAGRVTDVKVKAGDKVKVGQVVLSVEDSAARGPAGTAQGGRPRRPKRRAPRRKRRAARTQRRTRPKPPRSVPRAGPKDAQAARRKRRSR